MDSFLYAVLTSIGPQSASSVQATIEATMDQGAVPTTAAPSEVSTVQPEAQDTMQATTMLPDGWCDVDEDCYAWILQISACLGLRPPMLFPAAECWQRRPPVDDYMTDLLHGFSKLTTRIYARSKPHDLIIPPPLYKVLRQLHSPDLSSTKYAINMFAESVELRIPDRLIGYVFLYRDSDLGTTTNITPKFSSAELHIDHGKHSVTLLHGGCVKLWVLYPLTPHNLERFSTLHRSEANYLSRPKIKQSTFRQGLFMAYTLSRAVSPRASSSVLSNA
ncbi:hypothetical protein F5Y16DRAFT_404223 [Xylariaceae sp. FL0255]|nr:hypothetical protein F5Y16DRAFT_404223 [Xylariaceae sp. FL0255]